MNEKRKNRYIDVLLILFAAMLSFALRLPSAAQTAEKSELFQSSIGEVLLGEPDGYFYLRNAEKMFNEGIELNSEYGTELMGPELGGERCASAGFIRADRCGTPPGAAFCGRIHFCDRRVAERCAVAPCVGSGVFLCAPPDKSLWRLCGGAAGGDYAVLRQPCPARDI